MATSTIKRDSDLFYAGETHHIYSTMFIGRTNSAYNTLYGEVILPKRCAGDYNLTISNVVVSGIASIGQTITSSKLNLTNISKSSVGNLKGNSSMWISIPLTGITAETWAIIRLSLDVRFS